MIFQHGKEVARTAGSNGRSALPRVGAGEHLGSLTQIKRYAVARA